MSNKSHIKFPQFYNLIFFKLLLYTQKINVRNIIHYFVHITEKKCKYSLNKVKHNIKFLLRKKLIIIVSPFTNYDLCKESIAFNQSLFTIIFLYCQKCYSNLYFV